MIRICKTRQFVTLGLWLLSLVTVLPIFQGCRKSADTQDSKRAQGNTFEKKAQTAEKELQCGYEPNTTSSTSDTKLPEPIIKSHRAADREKDKAILSLKDILGHPDKYDGRSIVVDCYYLQGFETVILSSNIVVHEDGNHYVENGDVWVSWGINPPRDSLSKLKKLPGLFPGGSSPLYGRVKAEGIFKIAGGTGIGHLGEYKYGFEIWRFQVFDESSNRFLP